MRVFIIFMTLFSFNAFALSVSSQQDVSVDATSTGYLNVNPGRGLLFIQNKDATGTVYVKFNSAHSGTEGIKLAAGEKLLLSPAPHNQIFLKSDPAETNAVSIMEGPK